MAVYIPIRKLAETPLAVTYRFGKTLECLEFVAEVEKATGAVVIATSENGSEPPEPMAARVKRKLYLHWKSGSFPEATCWAS